MGYITGSGYENAGPPVTAFQAKRGERVFWEVRQQEVINHDPRTGERTSPGTQLYVHVDPGPLVVATRDNHRELLVIKRERVPTNAVLGYAAITLFELPGGGLNKKKGELPPDGELPTPANMIDAGKREMLEESGYVAEGAPVILGGFMADPLSDNYNTTVLIPNVSPAGDDARYEQDPDESIGGSMWITWQEARKMRGAGLVIPNLKEVLAINSAPSAAAIVQAQEYLEDTGAFGAKATIIDMAPRPVLNGAPVYQ